jgi:hypothetical protein
MQKGSLKVETSDARQREYGPDSLLLAAWLSALLVAYNPSVSKKTSHEYEVFA